MPLFHKLKIFYFRSALIIIGMINGLALLPVMLSLIGPPCEVSNGGKNYLECPTSRLMTSEKMALEDSFIISMNGTL
jgi:hypothetical protein